MSAETEDERTVKVEGSRDFAQDPGAKQIETELTREVKSALEDWTGEEGRENKEEAEREIEATSETKPVAESVITTEETKEKNSQLYEKKINLLLMPPVDVLQAKSMGEELRRVQNLRVLLVGGSADGGVRIVVSVGHPIPLADALGHWPTVEKVAKSGNDLRISPKTKA